MNILHPLSLNWAEKQNARNLNYTSALAAQISESSCLCTLTTLVNKTENRMKPTGLQTSRMAARSERFSPAVFVLEARLAAVGAREPSRCC